MTESEEYCHENLYCMGSRQTKNVAASSPVRMVMCLFMNLSRCRRGDWPDNALSVFGSLRTVHFVLTVQSNRRRAWGVSSQLFFFIAWRRKRESGGRRSELDRSCGSRRMRGPN